MDTLIQHRFFEDAEDELPYVEPDPYANLPDWSHLFSLESWKRKGEKLVRDNAKETDQSIWAIGDWLVEADVIGRLPDTKLKEHAEKITKKAWKTLRNYKVTCRAIPPTSSRRRDGLSYSIHDLVAKFDQHYQTTALDRAEELQSDWKSRGKKTYPVAEFKKELKRLQQMGSLPRDENTNNGSERKENPSDPNVPLDVEVLVRLTTPLHELLTRLAFARYGTHTPKKLIGEMFMKYWTDHKDELKAMLAAEDPKLKCGDRDNPNPLP
jgi:hypothetical protein